MKIKYLLPVLAGVAFSACSQDEDMLSTNVQQGEYSPITFSVSKEGDLNAETKGVWEDMDAAKPYFNFEMGDLLSMWNGMTWDGSANKWTSIGQNAVFEGMGSGESLVFKTRSLVNKGTAILVYPADTTFSNTAAVTVNVPAAQDAKTKQFLPYVSDVMNIAERNATQGTSANNTAGYGRNYDVLLRPIGSLFQMTLAPTEDVDLEALGVAPIEFREVQINNDANVFAESATITQSGTASVLPNADENGKYDHFDYMTDVTATASTGTISTTDIENNEKAYFTLLPNEAASFGTTANIVVSTSYGTVTISNNAAAAATDKGPLQNKDLDAGKNLAENLAGVMNSTWKDTENSKFGTEKQGRVIRRTLSLDLSDLDMDETVVTTSKQLIDLLKVYKAFEIEDNITLILDGETEDDVNFVMTKDALKALKDYSANRVTLDVATQSNSAIVLAGGAVLADLADASVKFSTNGITAILAEDATLDQGFDGCKVNGVAKVATVISNAALTYTNSKNSTTAATYELQVNGTINYTGSKFYMGELTTGANSQMTISSPSQTVTFKGMTTLSGKVENKGIMSAAAAVTNKGKIDNQFEVSVLVGSNGSFTNIGEIHNNGANAVTYITYNATTANKGRIILTNRNDNVSIDAEQGYIVYTIAEPNNNGVYTYSYQNGDVFNWLEIKTTGVAPQVSLSNERIDYLDIKGDAVNVTTNGTITVTDLFVNPSMRLLGDNAITATNIYVNDYILHSGNLTGSLKTEYTSGVFGESKDSKTYKNGQIRTISGN